MHQENILVEEPVYSTLKIEQKIIYSEYLEREVVVDLYIPFKDDLQESFPLLFINDGQDLAKMNFASILDSLFFSGSIEPMICVG
ncbi:MAG: alpha/beta hydrolase, partial [Segetibacter sp.]